jgi:hypothetical protein
MAKKQPKTKITTEVLWEYEYVITAKGQQSETIWIAEDDERSAHKAVGRDGVTGNIRTATQKVSTTKGDREILETSEWVVKRQTMLPQK